MIIGYSPCDTSPLSLSPIHLKSSFLCWPKPIVSLSVRLLWKADVPKVCILLCFCLLSFIFIPSLSLSVCLSVCLSVSVSVSVSLSLCLSLSLSLSFFRASCFWLLFFFPFPLQSLSGFICVVVVIIIILFIFIFILLMLYLSIAFCNNISLWMSWLLIVLWQRQICESAFVLISSPLRNKVQSINQSISLSLSLTARHCMLTVRSDVSDTGWESSNWILLVFQSKHTLCYSTWMKEERTAGLLVSETFCVALVSDTFGCNKALGAIKLWKLYSDRAYLVAN